MVNSNTVFEGCIHATQFTQACEIQGALIAIKEGDQNARELVDSALVKPVDQGMPPPEPILKNTNLCGGSPECQYYCPAWRNRKEG